MMLWLDIEATGHGAFSYPIELAWVDESSRAESYLLRPHPGWMPDWDPAAEALHGITRERLEAEGHPVEAVARRFMTAARGRAVVSDAPEWDQAWLDELLVAAGMGKGAVFVGDHLGLMRVAAESLWGRYEYAEAKRRAEEIVVREVSRARELPRRHRALEDAQRLRGLFQAVCYAAAKA